MFLLVIKLFSARVCHPPTPYVHNCLFVTPDTSHSSSETVASSLYSVPITHPSKLSLPPSLELRMNCGPSSAELRPDYVNDQCIIPISRVW